MFKWGSKRKTRKQTIHWLSGMLNNQKKINTELKIEMKMLKQENERLKNTYERPGTIQGVVVKRNQAKGVK